MVSRFLVVLIYKLGDIVRYRHTLSKSQNQMNNQHTLAKLHAWKKLPKVARKDNKSHLVSNDTFFVIFSKSSNQFKEFLLLLFVCFFPACLHFRRTHKCKEAGTNFNANR